MRLNNAEVRVQLLDDVWLVFNGLLGYIALPLFEAKLKNKKKGRQDMSHYISA